MKKFIAWQRVAWERSEGIGPSLILGASFFLSILLSLPSGLNIPLVPSFIIAAIFYVIVSSALGAIFIRIENSDRKIKAVHPDEPWLWRKDWRKGVIKGTHIVGDLFISFFGLLIGALISVGCIAILWLFFWDELWSGMSPYWMLPVVGLGGTILALYSFWNIWGILRFRSPEFRLTKLPGTIGGELTGVLLLKSGISIVNDVEVTLRCIHEYRAGKNITEDEIWEKTYYLSPGEMARWSLHDYLFDVNFSLPEEMIASREVRGMSTVDAIRWYIEVRTKVSGPDLNVRFEVPVFKTDRVVELTALSEMEKQYFVHVNPDVREKEFEPEDCNTRILKDSNDALVADFALKRDKTYRISAYCALVLSIIFVAGGSYLYSSSDSYLLLGMVILFGGLLSLSTVKMILSFLKIRSKLSISQSRIIFDGSVNNIPFNEGKIRLRTWPFWRNRHMEIANESVISVQAMPVRNSIMNDSILTRYDLVFMIDNKRMIWAQSRIIGAGRAQEVVSQIIDRLNNEEAGIVDSTSSE